MVEDNIVVSTRIRLARNVFDMDLSSSKDSPKALNFIGKVNECLIDLGKYKVYHIGNLSPQDATVMVGKHLISKELLKNTVSGAALVNEDETVSVMVNEEDHIRAQCILKGFDLDKAYKVIDEIDDELDKHLNIAFDEKFGYLTSCLTNVGTGLRASVMLFLPAITLEGSMDKIIQAVKQKGLTVRGELGEGSFPLGYLYQLSNAVTIGYSEEDIISSVKTAVKKVIEIEIDARRRLLKENPDMIVDMVFRAYGILSNCYTIDYNEFMKLVGELKLGLQLKIIEFKDPLIVDKLIDICSDSGLVKIAGKNLTKDEINRFRASYLGKNLRRAKI